MSLTFPARSYPGGAAVAGTLNGTLASGTGAGGTFTSSSSLTGWTDVTGGSFSGDVIVAFGYGTATEEFILCTFNPAVAGGTFTIVQRAYNLGAVATTWTNAPFICVATATEAAEWSAAVQALKTILTNSGSGTAPANITVDGSVSLGTAQQPSAIDHDHVLPSSALNTWLAGELPHTVSTPVSNSVTPTGVNTLNVGYVNLNSAPYSVGTAAIVTVSGFTKYLVTATVDVGNGAGVTHSATIGLSEDSAYTSVICSFQQTSILAGASSVITTTWSITLADTASHTLQVNVKTPSAANGTINSNSITAVGVN